VDDAGGHQPINCLPSWHYKAPSPDAKPNFNPFARPDINAIDLGDYVRNEVTNLEECGKGREYFDMGLRLMLSYQHELAARCFITCLETSRYCALAHGFVALCHSPNYNFKGEAYYESAHHPEEEDMEDLLCIFPSQQVADRHSKKGVDLIEEIRKLNKNENAGGKGGKKGKSKHKRSKQSFNSYGGKGKKNSDSEEQPNDESTSNADGTIPKLISDVETQLLFAIRILACHPGLEHTLAEDIVGKSVSNQSCTWKRCFSLLLFLLVFLLRCECVQGDPTLTP
jgi:hypothetical protein